MATEDIVNKNVKAFLEVAQADPELHDKLRQMDVDQLVAAAREKGFELSEADFAAPAGEMGDVELDNVAGGWAFCIAAGTGWGKNDNNTEWNCGCIASGGVGGISSNCDCFVVGIGDNS